MMKRRKKKEREKAEERRKGELKRITRKESREQIFVLPTQKKNFKGRRHNQHCLLSGPSVRWGLFLTKVGRLLLANEKPFCLCVQYFIPKGTVGLLSIGVPLCNKTRTSNHYKGSYNGLVSLLCRRFSLCN